MRKKTNAFLNYKYKTIQSKINNKHEWGMGVRPGTVSSTWHPIIKWFLVFTKEITLFKIHGEMKVCVLIDCLNKILDNQKLFLAFLALFKSCLLNWENVMKRLLYL